MTKRTKTILLIAAGVVISAGVVVVGTAVWLFASTVTTQAADEPTAQQTMARARERFDGTPPLLEMRSGHPVLSRTPPDTPPVRPLERVHVIAWDRNDEQLSRVTLPFWLLRLKTGPIDLVSEAGVQGGERPFTLTADDIERYGPALLIDHVGEEGTRVLVWTE